MKPEDHLLRPVERVSWQECSDAMHQVDLCLPTEAQWEYARRSETSTPWSVGERPRDLEGHANLNDQACVRKLGLTPKALPWDDGYGQTAPVRYLSSQLLPACTT